MSGTRDLFTAAQLAAIREVLGLPAGAEVDGATVVSAVLASRVLGEAEEIISDELHYIVLALPLGLVRWQLTLDDMPQPPPG